MSLCPPPTTRYYQMNIPIFAPSLALLMEWHLDNFTVWERTWAATFSRWNGDIRPTYASQIDAHPDAPYPHLDPNNEHDRSSNVIND